MSSNLRWRLLTLALLVPGVVSAQDAGPDGGDPDGGDAAPDGGELCGDGYCVPPLTCIDGICGECDDGQTRACDEGCGPGIQTCNYDTRSWGRCSPREDTECDPTANDRTHACDHPCGPAYNPCSPATCEYTDECIPEQPVQCTPGLAGSAICLTTPNSCQGHHECLDDCTWSDCIADEGIVCCGNGVVDDGEECDGEEVCGDDCKWTDARPFRSCDCRLPGRRDDVAASFAALLALVLVALLFARRKS